MPDRTREQLEQAYDLIQQERLDDAIALLRNVLAREPDNMNAWWLMANAVSEPDDAAEALSNVLRLDPNHADARDAYNQLVAEYPHLASGPKMPDISDELGDISVDIDDLLARTTGPLDAKSQTSPLMRKPPTSQDVSDYYLEQAWAARSASDQPVEEDDSDLDEFFGGKSSVDVPATENEDEELARLFGAQEEPGPRAAASVETQDMDSFFFGAEESEFAQSQEAGRSSDFDDIFAQDAFGDTPQRDVEGEPAVSRESLAPAARADREDIDLDAMFGASASAASAEAKPVRGRAGRAKKQREPDPFEVEDDGTPGFVDTIPLPGEPAKAMQEAKRPITKKTATPRPEPRPVRMVDPLELERRANRRRVLPRALMALVVIAAVVAAVLLLVPRLTAPDPVTQVAQNTRRELADRGFNEPAVARSGDVLQVTICGLAGPGLQRKVFQAMDLIAEQVVTVSDAIKSAQIEVVTCGSPDIKLYRASAPMDAVTAYVSGGKTNRRAYRAAWQRN